MSTNRDVIARPRQGGKTTEFLDQIRDRVAVAEHRLTYVTADPDVARLLAEHLGDTADVGHQKYAPRGVVLEFPTGGVPTFTEHPETAPPVSRFGFDTYGWVGLGYDD